jgi:hypothetical protein
VDADLDTLATARSVTADDLLKDHPERVPARPVVGLQPKITDAEVLTLAVMQALLGFTSERRWIRYAHEHLLEMFPTLPRQSGYSKPLRKLADTMSWLISALAADTSLVTDDVWVVDSTPSSAPDPERPSSARTWRGWAEYGYCASHTRFFWGLRLHLVCTLHGLPVGWALTGAKADERSVLADIVANTPALAHLQHSRLTWIADKNYHGKDFEADVADTRVDLLRPTRKREKPRPGERFFKPLRQIIESVNDTLKGQLDLERHGGRTIAGVCARVAQRILALTAAIWHNDRIGASIRRSLIAYDH